MTDAGQPERRPHHHPDDWVADARLHLLVWGAPKLAIVLAAFAPVPLRTAVWSAALAWMGIACLLNARRCGRVHCRYSGPFYLALILPVLLFGTSLIEAGSLPGYLPWLMLGGLGLFGGTVITRATERAGGRYRAPGRKP